MILSSYLLSLSGTRLVDVSFCPLVHIEVWSRLTRAMVCVCVCVYTCSLLISLRASMCSFLTLSISSRSSESDKEPLEVRGQDRLEVRLLYVHTGNTGGQDRLKFILVTMCWPIQKPYSCANYTILFHTCTNIYVLIYVLKGFILTKDLHCSEWCGFKRLYSHYALALLWVMWF